MNKTRFGSHVSLNRRNLFKFSAVGGAALLLGSRASHALATAESEPWFEAGILDLQLMMASGELSSRELTLAYLQRIRDLNPLLGAVIETNPNAVSIAARLDNERRKGNLLGPLHGIPILLKDNIASNDRMETTAGSFALLGSRVPRDATVTARLRAAGAVILGKANLSEWANFRGFAPFNGWSARGGFTRNPYVLDFDPCGSSSGSAVAPAANMCVGAIGTETDGSIVCPAGNSLIVGIKPTVGLVAQDGIIPIAASQDSAGPMARSVTDAAIMLGVLRSPFGEVAQSNPQPPTDYTPFLQRGALNGARIGVDVKWFDPSLGGDPLIVPIVNQAIAAMESLGATIVETDSGDPLAWVDDEFTSLLFEFKVQIAQYLAGLHHTKIRSLADLIRFNEANCNREMEFFGQEIFELAEQTSGNLNDPQYVAARGMSRQLARNGIDDALQNQNLDALVAPSYSFASTVAATAGYPNISVPVGIAENGVPAGIWIYSGFLQEPLLIALAYDIEQELQARVPPSFLGTIPADPPNAGICGSQPLQAKELSALRRAVPWRHLGSSKLLSP